MLTKSEEEEQVVPGTSKTVIAAQHNSRPPLVTRHVPNRQVPAEMQAASSPVGLESQTSQVLSYCNGRKMHQAVQCHVQISLPAGRCQEDLISGVHTSGQWH